MRMAITGDRDDLTMLAEELAAAGAGGVERVDEARDESDLQFSVADAATLVGLISALLPLCQALVGLARRGPRTQRLRLKTALGSTEVELPADITVEELHRRLAVLVPR